MSWNRVVVSLALFVPGAWAQQSGSLVASDGQPTLEQAPAPGIVERLAAEAEAVRPLVKSDLARAWLDGVAGLPSPDPRVIHYDPQTRDARSPGAFAEMPEDERGRFREAAISADRYYLTFYGSPIAYARAVDVIAAHGVEDVQAARVLDFGCGGIAPLRLFASAGAHAVGVDVDPRLEAMYAEPGDTGAYPGDEGPGSVEFVRARWPGEAGKTVGGGFRVVISKNTLKRGYVRPQQEVDPAQLIDLGVEPLEYLEAVHDALEPGGLFVLYNLAPAPDPEAGFRPMEDGLSPWTRDEYEAAGFEVLALDEDDLAEFVPFGVALGWGEADQLKEALRAWCTVVRRR